MRMGKSLCYILLTFSPHPALLCCALSLQVFPEAVDPGDVVAQLECKS